VNNKNKSVDIIAEQDLYEGVLPGHPLEEKMSGVEYRNKKNYSQGQRLSSLTGTPIRKLLATALDLY
jgi:hypothetical protein